MHRLKSVAAASALFVAGGLHAALASAQPAAPQAPATPAEAALGDRIAQALFVQGRLWLRGAPRQVNGDALVAVDLDKRSSAIVQDHGVISIARIGSSLWVLRDGPDPHQVVVSRWDGERFEDLKPPPLKAEDVVTLTGQDVPVVVTSTSVVRWENAAGDWSRISLRSRLLVRGIPSAAVAGRFLYLGQDAGEFGGGLQVVDLDSGVVRAVNSGKGADDCHTLLSLGCSAVNAVISDPTRSECIIAAAGMVHFFSKGGVVRVCGTKAGTSFSAMLPPQPTADSDGTPLPPSPDETAAMFGLAVDADNSIWALSDEQLYHLDADGLQRLDTAPMPTLKTLAGVRIGRLKTGLLVIGTNVNAGMSLSGETPLLVSTDSH